MAYSVVQANLLALKEESRAACLEVVVGSQVGSQVAYHGLHHLDHLLVESLVGLVACLDYDKLGIGVGKML